MKNTKCAIVKQGECKCKISTEQFKEGKKYKYEILAYSDREEMFMIIATENKFVMQCTLETGKYYFEIQDDEYVRIETLEEPKTKEYKAKLINSETGEVITEGIWNTKGEFKEDKSND